MRKGMFELDTRKEGINRSGNHMKRHGASDRRMTPFQWHLHKICIAEIEKSSAYTAALDLRLMSFTDQNHAGMKRYVRLVFKSGQSVPLGVNINPDSLITPSTCVNAALNE